MRGFPLTVRVTVNRFNVDDLENVAHLLLDEIGLPNFSTNEAYACGATERSDGGIMLTPAQREQAMQTLAMLEQRYPGRISACSGPQVLASEIKSMDELLDGGQTTLPGRGRLTACGGVFNTAGCAARWHHRALPQPEHAAPGPDRHR